MDNFIQSTPIEVKNLIDTLDITPLFKQLTCVDKWSSQRAEQACQEYKIFLALKQQQADNDCEFLPSADVDAVWLTHILHTDDYLPFCKQVFGEWLHHPNLSDMLEDQPLPAYQYDHEIYEARPFSLGGCLSRGVGLMG